MAGTRLVKISTSFVSFEIHGPARSHLGVVQPASSSEPAHLAVETTNAQPSVTWYDSGGAVHEGITNNEGPHFFEETTYRLRVKSLVAGHVPQIVHRDPALLDQLDLYADDLTIVGPINFRRQVGRSMLEVRVGNESLVVTLEVFPVKVDYASDYQLLLSEVNSAARGLVLEYLRSTYRSAASHEVERASALEWLLLVRNELRLLEDALRFLNDHPHRALHAHVSSSRVQNVRRVDASVRRAVSRGKGWGEPIEVPGLGRVRSILPSSQKIESLDTPEHRWLRLQLMVVHERLTDLHAFIAREIDEYKRTQRDIPKRLNAELSEVAGMVVLIKQLLALPLFENVVELPPSGFSSLTLLGGAGYSEAYRAFMMLRLGLDLEVLDIDVSVMDLDRLYETWCFVRILTSLCSMMKGHIDASDLIQIDEKGIRVRLRQGERSAIVRQSDGRTLTVVYSPDFGGLTGDQRPDIVLRFKYEGWPDLVIVLDAKYRLDASNEYRTRFGTVGPPRDAINALHRYRDAICIVDDERGLQRPVVKGAALFPLGSDETESFENSALWEALHVLGIGALPFLPGQTSIVEKWLETLLALPPEDLADPGPPFSGLAEKHLRELAGALPPIVEIGESQAH